MSAYGELEWEAVRAQARSVVETALRSQWPGIRLGAIAPPALDAARAWNATSSAGWDWTGIVKRPKKNRFDLAVWYRNVLCGLAWGPADADAVALEYLQGNPDPGHPLRGFVIRIVLVALEAQARAAGVRETRLLGPLPSLVPVYRRYGYEAVASRGLLAYLSKRGTSL